MSGNDRLITPRLQKNFILSLPFLVSAALLFYAYFLTKINKDPMSWRWPFHKEGTAFVVFTLGAVVTCVMPVYVAVLKMEQVLWPEIVV